MRLVSFWGPGPDPRPSLPPTGGLPRHASGAAWRFARASVQLWGALPVQPGSDGAGVRGGPQQVMAEERLIGNTWLVWHYN